MTAKTFEVRDRMTFIPVLAVRLDPGCEEDRYLLARSGYGLTAAGQAEYVQLMNLHGGSGDSKCDPEEWGDARTMSTAHQYIIDNFEALPSGSVVDVQFILKETKSPVESDRLASPGIL
jgi:hypothetical protein